MTEYARMKKTELQELLKHRSLPYSGNKAILVQRLQYDDSLYTPPPAQQAHDSPETSPEYALEALKDSDPRAVTNMLRKLVHNQNLRHAAKMMLERPPADCREMSIKYEKLTSGQCLEPTCSLCGTGTLCESLDHLHGSGSKCTDRTCKDFNNCSNCRGQLQELEDAYIQRERDSCIDGSCGDLSKCLRCEKHIRDAIIPTILPDDFQGPLHPKKMSGDTTQLRRALTDMRSIVHNEYLHKLSQKLQNEKPGAGEWIDIKQKLAEGKCLGLACSSCGTATLTESMETLVDGASTDCGGRLLSGCGDIITCLSCRKTAQDMEDTLSRYDKGRCGSGLCDNVSECSGCRDRLDTNGVLSGQLRQDDENNASNDEKNYCCDENCSSFKTCGACQWEKEYEDMKRAEADRDMERWSRFKQQGRCDRPDPDLPYGLGCHFVDCERCGMIEAITGPKMRNNELRRRSAEKITTSLTQSCDGTMTGASRKRRFSSLGLQYPLPPSHILAKRVRTEEQRERPEQEQALIRHERPQWFGTPEDPLPDLWMGRPALPEKEISILKILNSIPKYYLSKTEEKAILLARGPKEKRLCTIIRRLESELMSRDLWMQSLGFNADDDFGNFPSGHYTLDDAPSTSTPDLESTRVERWISTLPNPSTLVP